MHRSRLAVVALALSVALAASSVALAQGGGNVNNAVGVWGQDSATGLPCIIAPAAGSATCTLPTRGGAPSAAGTAVDASGTLTTGGVAQTAIVANTTRKGWCVQNPPNATETLSVRIGATATATTGVSLSAGQQACNAPGVVDTALISVFAATTGHAWLGTEWQ